MDDKTKYSRKLFFSTLITLVLPIIIQNFIAAAVNSADTIMLSFVSQSALSGVSLASQIQFVFTLFLNGCMMGTQILVAQYWGKGEKDNVHKIMGVGITLAVIVASLFALASLSIPQYLMRLFTNETPLIENGIVYLRICAISFIFMGISSVILTVLKSTKRAFLSAIIGSSSLIINIILNAIFIFGLLGSPKLGVVGVALATLIARAFEMIVCIIIVCRTEHMKLTPRDLIFSHKTLTKDFFRYAIPVIGNFLSWGSAFTMYSVILGHLGEDVVAANSIASVVRNLSAVVCCGIGSGGAIMIGNQLGNGEIEHARIDGGRLVRASIATGAIGGLLVLLARPLILHYMPLSPLATDYLSVMLYINSYYIIGKAINSTVIGGIFAAGGDSRFGFLCDTIDMWVFSVPLGFLCAFVFKIPVAWVYFVLCLDEFVKIPVVYIRYKKYKWLRNLTR